MDSLSPESRALYEILMADTPEIYESKFAAYKKDRLDAVKQFVADKRMYLQTIVDNRALTVASVDCTPATVPAAAPFDSTPTSVLLSSTATALTTSAASHHVLSLEGDATVDDFSPGGPASSTAAASPRASSCASSTGGFPKSAAATAASEKDLHSKPPSTCLTVCLGADTTMSPILAAAVSVSTSTRVSMSATSLAGDSIPPASVVPEVTVLQYPTTLNVAPVEVDINATDLGSTVPTTCSSECPSHEAPVPPSVIILPITISDEFMSPAVGDLLKGGDALTLQPPWPPPAYVNLCKDMHQALLLDGLVLQSMQLLWPGKYRWSPPFPNISTACRSSNMDSTMDIRQALGDCQVLKAVELNIWAALLVIIFALGVQSAQLQPTRFNWSVCSCHDTHLLSASSNLCMKLELILARQATYTEWVLLNCHSARVQIQWIITVQRHTSSSVVRKYPRPNLFLAILSGETEVQQHYFCTRVLTVAACKVWISHHIWRGSSQYPKLRWSFSHSILHSEILFYTSGHISFCCCALVQWKIPWTITLVLLGSRFQYYHARSEFLYSCEKFQWTIAWFLCYLLSLSMAWLFSCPLLVKLAELKPWPSLSCYFSSSVSWSCSCQQLGGLLDLIEWKPRTSGVYLWASYLGTSACGPDVIFMWLQFVVTCNLSPKAELLSNITIELKPWPSWELFPCNSAVTSCLCVASHTLANLVYS